ncbi:MFS transporter [Rhodococcus triatomae]|uniref:Predicted arabinose efflux permease, MFS family n=1 Tax=Rhodococcus triatomae TaxID=300028 RepID=A0A1G8ASA2_9NOCA|nr:MFS transporter [Rhodococcus triatomae]QNG21140.1 MFS transporter [Rhodococcus triatomae]QNG25568.1 MFS transporter [Rhodococcus triatomae]SDH23744.1 Predicted arabinose efflux permease, MFS family [Rhodococcus triatomae]
MFAALRTRNYRLWASGQIVSLVGTWMQRVAQDWLVLTLSDGNALAVGIVMALQFGPTLFLSVWGGVLADRYDKRRILMVTQVAMALCALVLGVLDVGGVVDLWHVYLIAFVLGCASAIDAPVRQSFTIEMVGPERLSNAIALNSMTFNTARIIGPAVSGVLITLIGTGWVFLLNVVTFAAVLVGLLLMRVDELMPAPATERAKGQVREGFRYVWGRADLRVLMAAVFMVSTFGLNFPISLAVMARNTFGHGADAYGLLSTTLAIGTLAGAALAARRKTPPRLRTLLGAAAGFGVFEIAVGVMPTYALVAIMLVPTGALTLTFTTAAMNILQMSVPSEMRGRVMGIYMLCFLGGTPLGSPVLGWLADVLDPRAPLVVGGVISLLSGLLAAAYLMRHEQLRLRVRRPSSGRYLPIVELRNTVVCDATEQAVEAGSDARRT